MSVPCPETYDAGSSFGFTGNFDPTGEYLANAFAIYSNLLLRNLVTFNHVEGPKGNIVVPDVATSVPRPTNGGRTYTFKLKSGVRLGPPLNRAVTSQDFKYAIERLAKPKNGAQYAFYFNVIQGLQAYGKGEAKSISGIKTPNARTIAINLTQPTGDPLVGELTLADARDRLTDGLQRLPELAAKLEQHGAPLGVPTMGTAAFDAPPGGWVLELDQNRDDEVFGLMAASQPLSQILKPITLDPLVVADDAGYVDSIKAQQNLAPALKTALVDRLGA